MVPFWLIIGIGIFVLAVLIFKTQDIIFLSALVKKYFFTFIVAGIILFFAFSLYHISVNYGVSLLSYEGLVEAGKIYGIWFKTFFSNMARITGYAIGQDWLLTNSTG